MGSVKLHFTISLGGKSTQSAVHVKHVTNQENRHFIYCWFIFWKKKKRVHWTLVQCGLTFFRVSFRIFRNTPFCRKDYRKE